MKHLKLFESLDFTHDVYLFNDMPVKIVNIDYITSTEISVSYKNQDGSIQLFNDTIKDFEDSFTPVESDQFVREIPKASTKETKYNLVYYIGNKKIETIKRNLNSKLAYSLRANYSKDPIYKAGRIKAEKII